jgi:hypothetical protein
MVADHSKATAIAERSSGGSATFAILAVRGDPERRPASLSISAAPQSHAIFLAFL